MRQKSATLGPSSRISYETKEERNRNATMPLDELTKKRRTRAGHRGSATKIATKIKESLANASETTQTDKNVLKQLKDTLSEKLEALKLLDTEIVEILSNSEAEDAEQQLEREIQEADDTRAELQDNSRCKRHVGRHLATTTATATRSRRGKYIAEFEHQRST